MSSVASNKTIPLVALHFTVFVWAATALFAKLIPLPAEEIIMLRSIPALLGLTIVVLLFKISFRRSAKEWFIAILVGLLTAGHWVFFYQSVQKSSVAIGLITLYTYPLFTTLLEPVLQKERLKPMSLILSLTGLSGVAIIAFESMTAGASLAAISLGLLSALLFTGRNLSSKYLIPNMPSLMQMWVQVATSLAVLTLILGFNTVTHASHSDWALLSLLGILFVALPHTLFLYCLKHIEASKASLMSLIQPLYATVLAFLILGETPSTFEIAGGSIILATAAWATIESTRN